MHDDNTTLDLVDAIALDSVESEMDDIERALVRLGDGTYGTCEVCGERLQPDALIERPAARHCAAHLPIALG